MKWKPLVRSILTLLKKYFQKVLLVLGMVLLLAIILSFTDCPFWAYYWLGTHNADLEKDPDLVVLMGGGGMPSPDGLMRCYFAANIAEQYPDAHIVIAVPADTLLEEDSPDLLMMNELLIRGISKSRIFFEPRGVNTRSQALAIANMLGAHALDTLGVRIVTSPEHMYRSVAAFRKVGFKRVGGQPSFEQDIRESLLVKKNKGVVKPSDLKALNLRYNMWNYLKYEVTVARELCAIAYYKLRGWI